MRVGVDTGGTFTDVVARAEGGALAVEKRLSTPRDPAVAVKDAVFAAAAGEAPVEIVHSTTVGTNALLERRGGPTALVTTRGFEDVLALGRQARPELYALHPKIAPPLLGAAHRLGLDERLDASGAVLRAPTDAELARLVEEVRALGVASVAVCLLHAYQNPAHERLVARALAPLGLPISLSSDVLPLFREYERTSTTAVDAYLRPVMAPYLERLAHAFGGARLRVMQSSGGAMAASEAARQPVRTVLSGPAAGVVGARQVAKAAGFTELLTLDMGGTSTDAALVAHGELATTEEAEVAGCPIQLPMLAVRTVGAGGGSIARLDEGGALKVGPESAGAEPGPACYGRSGALPTVTDADLVLGRLDPSRFLGGAWTLDVAAARRVVGELATRLGKSVEATAEDVVAVADQVMARALKSISSERGHDPKDFVLVPFGGAGGMHACAVARELGMSRILVPPSPGLLCAYGALIAEVMRELVRTRLVTLGPSCDAASFDGEFAALEAEAARALDAQGVPEAARSLERSCTLRYLGQSFELAVPAAGELVAGFHAAHRARYGYVLDRPVELVTLRLRARGQIAPSPPPEEAHEAGDPEVGRITTIWQGRGYGAAIVQRRRLTAGARVDGPALIVEYSATTFVPPGARAEALSYGALLLTI
ncbi:MAG: hydantoinase/oxoprolinase family protein [Polyangia bacterium]